MEPVFIFEVGHVSDIRKALQPGIWDCGVHCLGSMDPDGRNPKIIAQGMRNAVDLHAVPELNCGLLATNMGDDHLGDELPQDTFFQVDAAPSAALGSAS
jgi:glucose/arabinose dehydrogenase